MVGQAAGCGFVLTGAEFKRNSKVHIHGNSGHITRLGLADVAGHQAADQNQVLSEVAECRPDGQESRLRPRGVFWCVLVIARQFHVRQNPFHCLSALA